MRDPIHALLVLLCPEKKFVMVLELPVHSRGKKARPDPINNTHDPSYVQGKILPIPPSNLGLPQVGFPALFSRKGQI